MDKLGDDGLVVDGRKLFFEYRYFFIFRASPVICTSKLYPDAVNYNSLYCHFELYLLQ